MSALSSLVEELRRRNVLKLVTAYAVASFIILQLCDILFPAIGVPDAVIGYVVIMLVLGLPFATMFAWMFEMTPDGLKRTREVSSDESITHLTGQAMNNIIIGLLSIAVIFFAYQYFTAPAPVQDMVAAEEVPEPAEVAKPLKTAQPIDGRPSIAVLPFVNMSSDEENEYFSDGLSEEVLNLLAQIQELRVAARTSSFFYKDKNLNLTEVGEALNVEHILEGSVRKSGNKVRITAQLISADDGFHLWSKTYDRTLDDIFAVQDEIAGEVTRAMQLTLLTDGVVISDRSTTSPEAYDLYLRAKNALYDRGLDNTRHAIRLFRQASALDPEYAPALIDFAVAELILYNNYGAGSLDDVLQKADAALEKVRQLDHLTSDYYAALALYYDKTLPLEPDNFSKAEAAYQKAIELNRNNVRPYMWYATTLRENSDAGDREQRGLALLEKALELDPLNRVANGNLTSSLVANGREPEALAHIERLIRIDPEYDHYHSLRMFFHLSKDDYVNAAQALKTVSKMSPQYIFGALNLLLAFQEEDKLSEVIDSVPQDSPSIEFFNLVEKSMTAMESELRAEAEILLLQPDPDFLADPLAHYFSEKGDHALVRRLVENARPAFRDNYSPAHAQGPHALYAWALHQLGEKERARVYVEDLLARETGNYTMNMAGSHDISSTLLLLLLDRKEEAIKDMVNLRQHGWLGYYQDQVEHHPLFVQILDDPRIVAIKRDIDATLAQQKPVVMQTLRDAGVIRSI